MHVNKNEDSDHVDLIDDLLLKAPPKAPAMVDLTSFFPEAKQPATAKTQDQQLNLEAVEEMFSDLHDPGHLKKLCENVMAKREELERVKEAKTTAEQNKAIAETELITFMTTNAMKSTSVLGKSFSVQDKTYYRVGKEDREDFFRWLNLSGLEHLIQPRVDTRTFDSYMSKEYEEEIIGPIPDFIKTHEDKVLSVRKAR